MSTISYLFFDHSRLIEEGGGPLTGSVMCPIPPEAIPGRHRFELYNGAKLVAAAPITVTAVPYVPLSTVKRLLHGHRILVSLPPSPLARSLLVELGDAGPRGYHGAQLVRVQDRGRQFSAGLAELVAVQFVTRGLWRDVHLEGHVGRAQGPSVQSGDMWYMDIAYIPGQPDSNHVIVIWIHAGQFVSSSFGGGYIPAISAR